MFRICYIGVFPPHRSGGAALTYWLLSEMVKNPEVEVYTGGWLLGNPRCVLGVKGLDRSIKLDALLFYYVSPKMVEPFLPSKGRVPFIAHHGFDNAMCTPEEFAASLSFADKVIATDNWERAIFEKAGLKNVVVIPYPVDTSIFTPKPKKMEILYSGRLLVYKGVLQVFEAMWHVLYENPQVSFRVHGYIDESWFGDVEINAALRNLKQRYGERVVVEYMWTPPWDMPKVYEGAYIFLFPSGRASVGLPLLEAMSMEIPVVTTSYGSHGEVVGDAGIKLEPKVEVCVKSKWNKAEWLNTVPSSEDIAEAVSRLIADESLRERLGREARVRVQEKFESKNVVGDLLKACQNLV